MDLVVFSRTDKVREYFKIYRKNNHFSLPRFFTGKDLKGQINSIKPDSFIYLDLNGFSESDTTRYLRLLARKEGIFYGLLDPQGKIKDAADLFHRGAADYVDKSLLKQGINSKRMNSIFQYLQDCRYETLQGIARKDRLSIEGEYQPSGKDWRQIIPGQEYTFYLMFIELDGKEEMEKKYGRMNLGIALASFRNYIERIIRSFNGKLWIWSRFGGLILFPFDLSEYAPITCIFRLLLFKPLYDIEESLFPHFLSFRMVLHIGSTLYSEADTGHIIADSLNSIFHLGQQFAETGNFYITEEVSRFVRPVYREYFLDAGIFEGRKILRLRRPVMTNEVEKKG